MQKSPHRVRGALTLVGALVIALVYACSKSSGDAANPPLPALTATVSIPDCDAARVVAPGTHLGLEAIVRDGEGAPLKNASVLFIAPDPDGGHASGTFAAPDPLGGGYHRAITDDRGHVVAEIDVGEAPGLFLIDVLVDGTSAEATFAITATSAKPSFSATDARCVLESLPGGNAESVMHGPFLLDAGASIVGSDASMPIAITKPTWFAWSDDAHHAKFDHPTRFITLDPSNPSSTAVTVGDVVWPTVALGEQSIELVPPWLRNRQRAVADDLPSTLASPTSLHVKSDPPAKSDTCVVIYHGLPDDYLSDDAARVSHWFLQSVPLDHIFSGKTNISSDGEVTSIVPPTWAEFEGFLDRAKALGCKHVFVYLSSHGTLTGLDHVRNPTSPIGEEQKSWIEVAGALKRRFAGTDVVVDVAVDACNSGVVIEYLQGVGLTGSVATAADKDNLSNAKWEFGKGWKATSDFTDGLLRFWPGHTLLEAYQSIMKDGTAAMRDPHPQYATLTPTPTAWPVPDVTLAVGSPAREVRVDLPPAVTPAPVDFSGLVTPNDSPISLLETLVRFKAGQRTGTFHIINASTPGVLEYTVDMYIYPYRLHGVGHITVTATTGDSGVGDSSVDGGLSDTSTSDASDASDGGTCGTATAVISASCVSAKTGLSTFHPSNLPSGTAFPATVTVPMSSLACLGCSTYSESDDGRFGACFPGSMYDSSLTTLTDGSRAMVLFVRDLTVAAGETLSVRGGFPVIIVASGSITVAGTIDASAVGIQSGPGGAISSGPYAAPYDGFGTGRGCGSYGCTASSYQDGAGGAGHCAIGGLGSNHTSGGGVAYGSASSASLVGGSSGGGSGVGESGAGGGALQLVAGTSIVVTDTGAITVAGGGGQAGAGGGSGGSLVLEAPNVSIRGLIDANGGGGGLWTSTSKVAGTDGGKSAIAAAGGSDGSGYHGGAGGAATSPAGVDGVGTSSSSPFTRAAGGGAAGYLTIHTACGTAEIPGTITPATSTSCTVIGTLTP